MKILTCKNILLSVSRRCNYPVKKCLLSTSFSHLDKKLFEKILVANRGEIAIRIMKTCKKLGIPTVAVYSEADEDSLFARYADEAVLIGPPPSLQSYLFIPAIINACKKTGATAVHPGYGFLSENSAFAKELDDNGINFIGPSSEAMRLMGDKIQSKKSAINANVNVVPGFDGVIKNTDHALEISHQIGFPVMIKAAGGGGGRGMRMAYNDQEVKDGFRLSSQEAKSSFNDDRILIEKYIEEPRHIEFQILGDKYGNVIHLNERDCSIQRRNQKVIEEAPSTFLTPELRKTMGEQAVRLAKRTDYYSAGTIEFLMDKYKNFYFLEMNTRLQVEHPITEMITGVDLVEQMIRIAAGEKLAIKQSDIGINGWSVEVRVNAENPYRNFGTPSIGRITRYIEPKNIANARMDSGIVEGSEISLYYDSLICKLVTHGETRLEAIDTVRKALDQYVIKGVQHNMSLIRDIMDNQEFCAGNITTKYLNLHYPDGFKGKLLKSTEMDQLCCCALYSYLSKELSNFPDHNLALSHLLDEDYMVVFDQKSFPVKVLRIDGNLVETLIEDRKITVKLESLSQENSIMTMSMNNDPVCFQIIARTGNHFAIQYLESDYNMKVLTKREYELTKCMPLKKKKDEGAIIKASMQGLLISINFKEGDMIKKGEEVAIIEAMKSQNAVFSSRDGKVKKVLAKTDSRVAEGETILEFEQTAE